MLILIKVDVVVLVCGFFKFRALAVLSDLSLRIGLRPDYFRV
jgi:hypothetical protein